MAYAFIAGFIIFNFGSITYAAALLKSTNPAIALLDYLSPPLSVILLILLGFSVLHPYLIIGTMLIIFGNVFLFLLDRDAAKIANNISTP
jgi:drug/metabolite transporter (DMT)-like permease